MLAYRVEGFRLVRKTAETPGRNLGDRENSVPARQLPFLGAQPQISSKPTRQFFRRALFRLANRVGGLSLSAHVYPCGVPHHDTPTLRPAVAGQRSGLSSSAAEKPRRKNRVERGRVALHKRVYPSALDIQDGLDLGFGSGLCRMRHSGNSLTESALLADGSMISPMRPARNAVERNGSAPSHCTRVPLRSGRSQLRGSCYCKPWRQAYWNAFHSIAREDSFRRVYPRVRMGRS